MRRVARPGLGYSYWTANLRAALGRATNIIKDDVTVQRSLTTAAARQRRALFVLLAALLFVSVFALRVAVTESEAGVGFLFVVPIALLALSFGAVGGLVGAVLALALLVLWQVVADVELGVAGYLSGVASFALVGGLVGTYAGQQREQRHRGDERADEARQEAGRRSEMILESITDAFVAWDRDWRLTYVNERAMRRMEAWAGRTLAREEILGKNAWALFPETVGTEVERRLRDAMQGQNPVAFEVYFPPTREWVEARAYPSQSGLSVYYTNISERKRTEEALRQAQRRSEAILESITDEFFAVDREWRYTYVNERGLAEARRTPGQALTAADLLGVSIWERFPELVGTTFDRESHRALREHRAVEFEFRSPVTGRWLEVRVYPSEPGLSIYYHDISERKRVEAELRRRAEQQALLAGLGLRALESEDLQPLLDEAVGLVAGTLDVGLVGVAEILSGGEQLLLRAGVGWTEGEVGEGAAVAAPGSLIHYTFASGEPVVSEDLAADERFEVSPLLAESGAVSGATVAIAGRDEPFGSLGAFSRRRRAFSEYELDFLQAVANVLATAVERSQADQRLDEVREAERRRIARGLHDEALQQLTHALALAQGARARDADADAADPLVSALRRAGHQLRGAIYDLRLEEQEGRPFSVQLEALAALHDAMADNCDVELETGDGAPTASLGRPGVELLRIVGEALTNARRHSGAGHITVKTRGSKRRLCVEVSDDGVGFDPAEAPSGAGGTGITGMHERADLIGADLAITSGRDSGSTVRVALEFTKSNGAEHVRVLLVEDHAAVREAIAAMFEREADFEVTGQAASLAEARGLLGNVDVAVVDLGLPDGYGGDLIRELREVNPRAQAVVLSGSLDRADIARAIESGAAGTLHKTAHLDQVVDAVRRLRRGETLLPPEEVIELLRFAGRKREQERDDRRAIGSLTAREREVLQGLAEGLDSQAIADRLYITIRTERNHIANILAKLGVHSQLQALVFALRYELVEIR